MVERLARVRLNPDGLRRNIRREGTPDRVYHWEHSVGPKLKNQIAERFGLEENVSYPEGSREFDRQREVEIQRFLGHELFRIWIPGTEVRIQKPDGSGAWENEHQGPIQSAEDLEAYAFPEPRDFDLTELEWYERNLPGDMGLYHSVHVWETVRPLVGFESFCYMLFEQPELAREITERVGNLRMRIVETLCDFDCVFCIYGCDDLGFKSSTFMDPRIIEDYFLSWHRRYAEYAHAHGKMYFLHCCGQIDALMDTIIDEVRVDGKHSFEDVICPVTEAKARWGNRVALLGGLDVDFLARSEPEAVRRRVREVLDVCMPGGGYCLGSGNWVTDYIPLDNYLAVLDEGRRYG